MEIIEMAQKIEKAGGRLYLVGGSLRDRFLQRKNVDEDYCVTGLTAEEFQKLFPEAILRGKAFSVFDLDGKEFAMARKEKKQGKGHKDFEIETDKKITIEQDLLRRDITINSMAQDVLTGELIDPYNGKGDIENKVIRATTEKFKEDPLRVYRVARFVAELGSDGDSENSGNSVNFGGFGNFENFENFEIDAQTLKWMEELKEELSTLSKERVFAEFRKALSTDKPSLFFDTLKRANVLDVHFKPIAKLIGALQPEKYHPEGDSYNHTMMVVDKAAELTTKSELEIRYAALVHDLGKGETPKEEYPHHYKHEERGVSIVAQFSRDIGVPTSWKKCGQVACREHMRGGIFGRMKPSKKVDFIERVDRSYLGLHGLQVVVNCDRARNSEKLGKEDERKFEEYQFEKLGKRCLKDVNAAKVAKKYNLQPRESIGRKIARRKSEVDVSTGTEIFDTFCLLKKRMYVILNMKTK